MHFYGMSYAEVIKLPIRVFWFLSKTVDRLSSVDQQQSLIASIAANSPEVAEKLLKATSSTIGTVVDMEDVIGQRGDEDELDREGLEELKNMGRM